MNSQERYDGAIALIKSQTNYTDDKAKEKLETWDGNYMHVIKEYLNPNFQEKKKSTSDKSVNEKMMFEIRNFMDTANADFLRRKKIESCACIDACNMCTSVYTQQAIQQVGR